MPPKKRAANKKSNMNIESSTEVKMNIDGVEKVFNSKEEAMAYLKEHHPELHDIYSKLNDAISEEISTKTFAFGINFPNSKHSTLLTSRTNITLDINKDGKKQHLVFHSFDEYKQYLKENYPELYKRMEHFGVFSKPHFYNPIFSTKSSRKPSKSHGQNDNNLTSNDDIHEALRTTDDPIKDFVEMVSGEFEYTNEVKEDDVRMIALSLGLNLDSRLERALNKAGIYKKRKGFLGLFGEPVYVRT